MFLGQPILAKYEGKLCTKPFSFVTHSIKYIWFRGLSYVKANFDIFLLPLLIAVKAVSSSVIQMLHIKCLILYLAKLAKIKLPYTVVLIIILDAADNVCQSVASQ